MRLFFLIVMVWAPWICGHAVPLMPQGRRCQSQILYRAIHKNKDQRPKTTHLCLRQPDVLKDKRCCKKLELRTKEWARKKAVMRKKELARKSAQRKNRKTIAEKNARCQFSMMIAQIDHPLNIVHAAANTVSWDQAYGIHHPIRGPNCVPLLPSLLALFPEDMLNIVEQNDLLPYLSNSQKELMTKAANKRKEIG